MSVLGITTLTVALLLRTLPPLWRRRRRRELVTFLGVLALAAGSAYWEALGGSLRGPTLLLIAIWHPVMDWLRTRLGV